MTSQLSTSLLITAIGMGLVFLSLLLLSFLMNILVAITTGRRKPQDGHAQPPPLSDGPDHALPRIAAIAVAMALEEEAQRSTPLRMPGRDGISAWQQAHRATRHRKQGQPR